MAKKETITVLVKDIPIETWNNFKATVPRHKTLNQAMIELIEERLLGGSI